MNLSPRSVLTKEFKLDRTRATPENLLKYPFLGSVLIGYAIPVNAGFLRTTESLSNFGVTVPYLVTSLDIAIISIEDISISSKYLERITKL
jgi:hypothetical protein